MKIVAEMGASHGRDIDRAYELISAAAAAGADAIKFQTMLPEEIAAPGAMINKGPWAGRSYFDLYREIALPWEWHRELFAYAAELGIEAFSAPFSESAVWFLETLNCPRYKIASPEITHLPLIECAARTGKPVIISTGMASYPEIDDAVETVMKHGNDLTLLVCVSNYPARPEAYALGRLEHFRREYGCKVGVSDHSLSFLVPLTAAALGADMYEHHLTLAVGKRCEDDAFAWVPACFKDLVKEVRQVEALREGTATREDADSLQYRRCIWVIQPIKAGEALTEHNVRALRPDGGGLAPRFMVDLTSGGVIATRDLDVGPLKGEDFRYA